MGDDAQGNPLVLVFSDDVDFYLLLDHILQVEGLATHITVSLSETLQFAKERRPDAILLDCRTRGASALRICTSLKQDAGISATPTVALIDQGAELNYVELIKSGIDDAFIRPVCPAKLVESLRSALESREATRGANASNVVAARYADLEMDLAAHRVRRASRSIHLSPIEFKLLRHFLERPEQVVTREELKSAAWEDNVHVGPRTVDVHVGRLRKALRSGSDKDLIRTVRSVGYALSDPVPDKSAPMT